MNRIIIAVDGYSGCGKSTTAKEVARQLGYTYVDSGAMYRAVTLYFLENNIDPDNEALVTDALKKTDISFRLGDQGQTETYLNGARVEDRIREMRVSGAVSRVSAIPAVRRAMVARQQLLGKERGVVMDGRDIGTVVFPDAELKVFLTAEIRVRAGRRLAELRAKGSEATLEAIVENLSGRDHADSTRADSPLKKADQAVEIDTSAITILEQVGKVLALARALIQKP
ncbi:MAG: (d)CMP kinase [Bacteroidota bacterium]